MSEFVPKLKQIKVAPDKMVLDPNNPRLITRDEDMHDEKDALDLMSSTFDKMRGISVQGQVKGNAKDPYNIKELENSIKQNGWWPIDYIFVKKYDSDGRYLVLEGNRRVTAIKNIRQVETNDKKLREQLSLIDVMEIVDDIPAEQLQSKITYLLGVRHHGSLVKWSPFAQASNIYNRYLELSNQSQESFLWDKKVGGKIANALSVDVDEVESKLRVFRVMEQIGNSKLVKESEESGGGMKGRYYSVCSEVLISGNNELKNYIKQDFISFLLDDDSVEKMISLCHFNRRDREDAPINIPQEWRKFANILKEQDVTRKEQMLKNVLINKNKPGDVWAERAAELIQLRWDKWLRTASAIIKKVTMGDDFASEKATSVTSRLLMLINKLEKLDK